MAAPIREQWRTLSPYLDEALEMTDAERHLWLDSLRAQDPPLADQLEALLDNHRVLAQSGFLDGRAAELPRESGLAGQTVGAYRLISQIGQGGMSSVWLAERNDARFERNVAVKFLKIALMGRVGEERFHREGIILGKLSHPHIAELFDAGVSHAGQPYLVLEYIEGDHIDRHCDRHNLAIHARIRLFLDALDAVAHAHDHQIVHRDLKPPNILVRNDGQVKLLDFSIAKLVEDGEQPGGAPLTAESTRMLTPEYAAPEQIAGGAVTAATDVYALGVVLYVLLTGCHPTEAGQRTHADLIKSILDSEPARPSAIVMSQARGDTPPQNSARRAMAAERLSRTLRGDLDTIIAKALKKRPEERYSSVRAMAADLQSYLKHEPIQARPDSIPYRARKFLRRHGSRVIATAFASFALTGATIGAWIFAHRQVPPPELKQQRLTANAAALPVLNGAISPDGKYLGYGDREGIHLQVVETGESRNVALLPNTPPPTAYWTFGSWYPDSRRFVASVAIHGEPVSLWSVPVDGQMPEKLADIEDLAGAAAVSPDGSQIAFAAKHSAIGAAEIWLMGARGDSPHRILAAENHSGFAVITWSPTGNRIAYALLRQPGDLPQVTIRTCDLNGANQTTILREDAISALTWVAPGRLIYSRSTQRGSARTGDLWELKVDDDQGIPQGPPQRRTDWSGFSIQSMNATADGKRLVFLRRAHHSFIFIGELAAGGNRLLHSRRLMDDDHINIAFSWTPDSREVIFSSQHAATRQIFKRAIEPGSTAQQLTSSPVMNFYLARPSPDGVSMLLEGEQGYTGPMGIYRADMRGGTPRLLFPIDGLTQFWCTNNATGLCVLGHSSRDRSALVISSFDPSGVQGRDLLRIPLEPGTDASVGLDYSWQLSPDGLWIALLKRRGNQIRLAQVRGGAEKAINVAGFPDLRDLNWSVDSQSLFVSAVGPAGAAMLHVDLKGDAQSIWRQPEATWLSGFPSPDGRHLAISSEAADANVWMFSNF